MQNIHWILLIVFSTISSTILYNILNSENILEPLRPKLTEATFFDPLCKDNQIYNFDYSSECTWHTPYGESLGSSTNIDDPKDYHSYHLKVLFLKMPLTDLYTLNPIYEISVKNAQLILRTTEDNYNINKTDS